jgi:hypothetical protein
MPAILCKCDNRISYGAISNPSEWLAISDVDYDKYTGMIDAEVLYAAMKSVLVCDQCKRLWIFKSGFQSDPICYSIDS